MLRMTTRKNHPSGLKRWNGKFSTLLESISGKIPKLSLPPTA
jgi:hypothetical protein